MIVLIKGCGANISSVCFALERLGHDLVISDDAECIRQADHVILPGVGTAQQVMQQLKEKQLISVIKHLKQPLLGICVGMQVLFESSEEDSTPGLGLIPGKVKALLPQPNLTLPHMGWNQLAFKVNTELSTNLSAPSHVYFVHSFAAPLTEHTIASCQHGTEFSAIVKKDNFYGMQFHPERSGDIGEQLLDNFVRLT